MYLLPAATMTNMCIGTSRSINFFVFNATDILDARIAMDFVSDEVGWHATDMPQTHANLVIVAPIMQLTKHRICKLDSLHVFNASLHLVLSLGKGPCLLQAYLAQLLPRERGQHCAAVGSGALAAHFSYFVQEPGLLRNASGLLQQYARCRRLAMHWHWHFHPWYSIAFASGMLLLQHVPLPLIDICMLASLATDVAAVQGGRGLHQCRFAVIPSLGGMHGRRGLEPWLLLGADCTCYKVA